MTRRPKVPDDKRQRIAQACDTCKQRKQKCNGVKPCQTCVKRNTTCTYKQSEPSETNDSGPFRPPSKRRHVEQATDSHYHHVLLTNPANCDQGDHFPDDFGLSLPSTLPGQDEEAEVYGQNRMLQDPNGRLLYVGDSATVSYLQLIRMVVESVAGPSQFTVDPSRHKITEAALTMLETARTAQILPEKKAADVLAQSFFTNTHGLIDIFDRRSFQQTLSSCYSSPLAVEPSDLCLVYLVLSIGLVMATPTQNSPEHDIITQLRSQDVDHAEAFFRGAKALGDPVSGFEDGDFWTVQALCLMSVYTLAVSKRNAAYVHLGQAVRSAHALGLHKVRETAMIFGKDHLAQRRNLWRSLFVLDRFLAMSLGRPTAISEDDCSEDSLEGPTRPSSKTKMRRDQTISSNGLNANVQASRIISQILKKVYSKHQISTEVAQDIADDCKRWANDLHHALDSSKLFKSDTAPAQGMAILHTQLLGCHSIILLTRPFFLYLLIKAQKNRTGNQTSGLEQNSRMERFSEACVAASTQTIRLAQAVFDSKRLPQRNPFILYFVFTAALLIMSNEFACLHGNAAYEESVTHAMNIMSYCSATDVQAGRFVFILTSFRDVFQKQATSGGSAQRSHPVYPARVSLGSSKDPTESLPSSHGQITKRGKSASTSPRSAPRESEADISHVSQAPMNPQGRPRLGMISTDVAGGAVSPVSSLTHLSQVCRTSEQRGSDPGATGSLHSEHEFHFDGFWEGSVSRVHTPGTGPGSIAQIHATETGDAMEYSNYATPGISSTLQN